MIQARSLKRQIILQFAAILLPLLGVLIYQVVTDFRRAQATDLMSQRANLASRAESEYRRFVDGIVDAVGSGSLARNASEALNAAHENLGSLQSLRSQPEIIAAREKLRHLQSAIPANAETARITPHRARVNEAGVALTALAKAAQADEDALERETLESARRQIYYVAIAGLVSCLLALIFIVRMIRGLTNPLQRAVSAAHTIAGGDLDGNPHLDTGGDIDGLIASLDQMRSGLRESREKLLHQQHELESRVEERTHELEDKLRQLKESESSLAEAQHLAQMGNWYWDIPRQITYWSDEMYRLLGYAPGACTPNWKSFEVLVDVRELEALREQLRAVIAAPGSFSADSHITTPDGLYRIMHGEISSTANAEGKVVRLHGMIHDITEQRDAEEKMHYLAMYDALTGLPNRQLFHQQLTQAVARAHRNGDHIAIMFIDLDRFKRINDTLGHATGDMLLREVAARLNRCVRTTDQVGRDGDSMLPEGSVARLAGDEFTVTLDTLRDPQDAARVARRIISEVSRPFMLSGQEVVVTTSIGIAVYPEDGEQAEMLLKNADVAMYQAKDLGRNAYQFFAGEMNSAAVERLRLENELRRAMEGDQLSLHYQIKIDARDGSIAGLEALMRWRHPELGMVPPVTFIPVAEEIGLIVDFGAWVLEEACRQTKAWRDAGLPVAPIAINLASPSFRQPDLVERVASALRRHDVLPADLCIEATESILMRDADATMATLKQLRELGVKLSIDDFGTGYSSLSYLRRFPIDQLKIDRSFVNDLVVNSDDAAIINAIASLARSLNLDVVAEGVETVEQARLLAKQGCYIMQGYFFSKPVSAEELTQILAQGEVFTRRIFDSIGGPFVIDAAAS